MSPFNSGVLKHVYFLSELSTGIWPLPNGAVSWKESLDTKDLFK